MDREPLHILVVDDDPDARDLLQYALADLGGHTVTTLGNAENLAQKIARLRPDALLLDLHLGQESGLEVLVHLQLAPVQLNPAQLADLVILIVSASDDPETVRRCLDAGARGLLTKPLDPLTLGESVARHIAEARCSNDAPQMPRSPGDSEPCQ